MTVTYSPLDMHHVGDAARLLREAYEEGLRPYLAYAQHGVAEFLADGVDCAWTSPGTVRHVALADGIVVGMAEWKRTQGHHFLSHVCTAREHRGSGVARGLIEHYLTDVEDPDVVELDVFTHNESARRLYERLGLEDTGDVVHWWRRSLDPALVEDATPRWTATSSVPSIAMLKRYGFCFVEGLLGDREIRFGVIGPSTVRVTNASDLGDGRFHALVGHLFPSIHNALLIGGAEQAEGLKLLLTSRRMRGRATHVRKKAA